jgi:hypothetical protein
MRVCNFGPANTASPGLIFTNLRSPRPLFRGCNPAGLSPSRPFCRLRGSIAAGAAIRPRDDPGRRRADSLALTGLLKNPQAFFRSAGGGPICCPVLAKVLAIATSWRNAAPYRCINQELRTIVSGLSDQPLWRCKSRVRMSDFHNANSNWPTTGLPRPSADHPRSIRETGSP